MDFVIPIDHLKKFTDERNQDFVDFVAAQGAIRVSEIQNIPQNQDPRIWKCMPQGDEWNISYYVGYAHIEYFTHEILHAYLIYKGFVDSKYLNQDIDQTSKVVEYIFTYNNLLPRLNNLFAHEKMFLDFKDRGFDLTLFTSDYFDVPNFQTELINEEFNEKHLPNQSIAQYIYSFFHAKDIRNPAFSQNVSIHLTYLQKLNPNLYKILDETWLLWSSTEYLRLNKPILEIMVGRVIEWHKFHSQK